MVAGHYFFLSRPVLLFQNADLSARWATGLADQMKKN